MTNEKILSIEPEDIEAAEAARGTAPTVGDPITISVDDLGPDVAMSVVDTTPVLSLTVEHFVIPVELTELMPGQTVNERHIDIQGKSTPGVLLQLVVNGTDGPTKFVDENGTFVFSQVGLKNGANQLSISPLSEREHLTTVAELNIELELTPYLGVRDWFTQEPLTSDNNIVRCKDCRGYLLG